MRFLSNSYNASATLKTRHADFSSGSKFAKFSPLSIFFFQSCYQPKQGSSTQDSKCSLATASTGNAPVRYWPFNFSLSPVAIPEVFVKRNSVFFSFLKQQIPKFYLEFFQTRQDKTFIIIILQVQFFGAQVARKRQSRRAKLILFQIRYYYFKLNISKKQRKRKEEIRVMNSKARKTSFSSALLQVLVVEI